MYDFALISAVIVALNELLKKVGLNAKFVPVVSVILGIIGGYFYLPAETVKDAIFNGIIVGLAANGLFDMSKVIKK